MHSAFAEYLKTGFYLSDQALSRSRFGVPACMSTVFQGANVALPLRSDEVIEALVMINCGESASAQARHLFRESLRSLVRLAKVEHGAELRFKLSRHSTTPDKKTVH